MIRQPFQSVARRARPDVQRVTDGIAASLRSFATAQARQSPDDDKARSSGRQRSAAAINELVTMGKSAVRSERSPGDRRPSSDEGSQNIISRSFSKPTSGGAFDNSFHSGPVNVIRGGFRGRGRGGLGRGGSGRGGFTGRGGFAARGGTGRGGKSRGGLRNVDDRPQRARRQKDNAAKAEENGPKFNTVLRKDPAVVQHRMDLKFGVESAYNPTLDLESLVGYSPAIPSSASTLGVKATVVREARMLGGGLPYNDDYYPDPQEAWSRFKKLNGVFYANSDVRKYVDEKQPRAMVTRFVDKQGEVVGTDKDGNIEWNKVAGEAFVPKEKNHWAPGGPRKEVTQAVFEAAVAGRYEGPVFTEASDPLGMVRNYAKRSETWSTRAERGIQWKLQSAIGGSKGTAKAGGAKPAAKQSAKPAAKQAAPKEAKA